jgi:slime mold cyclic AMP receptor
MPADCLWMFCMAINVFLTFQTTVHVNLRKMEKWYFLLCFGLPGIPALTYLILDTTKGTDFYGNAIVSLSPDN